jgi:hypothetical protein
MMIAIAVRFFQVQVDIAEEYDICGMLLALRVMMTAPASAPSHFIKSLFS